MDGAEALPQIAAAIRGAQHRSSSPAGSSVADFELTRGEEPARALVTCSARPPRGGVDVRLLAWAGAPLPLFRPSRRDVVPRGAWRARTAPGSAVAADRRERPMHCHHEKLVIVDDERRVRRRHRPDRPRRRPLRQRTAPDARSARLARRARTLSEGPVVARRRRALRACAGTRSTGERLAPPAPAAAGRRRRACSSSGPCPRRSTARSRAASSRSSRPTSARCARPSA